MMIDFWQLLSAVSIVCAIFFGYQTYKHRDSDDVEERASMNARVLTKLDTISDDIRDIKHDNQDMRKDLNRFNERLIVCEQKLQLRNTGAKETE